jgi:hypothetical protein
LLLVVGRVLAVLLAVSLAVLLATRRVGIVLSSLAILLPNRPPTRIRAAMTTRRMQERMKVGRLRLRILRPASGG